MKGIIVVFMLILVFIIVSLLSVWIYRTGINYRKKKRDLLGTNKKSRNRGGS